MIKRKTWSDGEVSAYLDRELDATTRDAFEAAMAQDRNLRRQVDDVREVVALMRAAPLREPSRNYLLTPEMVAETPAKHAERRRTPLLLMRLATSLTAAAFVVTVGLSAISRGVSPTMVTQDNVEIERQIVAPQEVEKIVEVESAEAQPAEKALSPESEPALAPLSQGAPAPGAVGESVDGGATEEKAAPIMLEAAPASEETEETAVDAVKEASAALTPEGDMQPEAPRVMRYNTTTATETVVFEPATVTTGVEDRGVNVPAHATQIPPSWLPGVLGAATLVLIGLTIWMSRKR